MIASKDRQHAATTFGEMVRRRREVLRVREGRRWSRRAVAGRAGITHTWLARIEAGEAIPTDPVIDALIVELGLPAEEARVAAGRPPPDVLAVLAERPLLAELVRAMQSAPDEAIEQVVRELRDGDW